jgi:hypothetical protein
MKTVEFREGAIVARQGDAALTAFILLYGEMVRRRRRRRRHICAGTELTAATSDTSRRVCFGVLGLAVVVSTAEPQIGRIVQRC